jgi:hypothetical protein
MPRLAASRGRGTLEPLVRRGVLGERDLPLRIVPEDASALDGWRFA